MLRKLIKYDIKSLNRFLLVMHAFLLLSTILIRICITGRIAPQTPSKQMDFLLMLASVLYFIIVVALSTGTYLFAGFRFYKNLFTDEGYLTRTLPVTSTQHLLSKTIAGSIWAIINMLLIYLCTYIVVWTPYVKAAVESDKAAILEELGFIGKYANLSFSTVMAVLILFSCFSTVSSIIMVYASIAIGQLFSSHRVLGAVVSYFAISTITSILSLIFMAIFSKKITGWIINVNTADNMNFIEYMIEILKLSGILALIITIVLYIITQYIMKKKINLM